MEEVARFVSGVFVGATVGLLVLIVASLHRIEAILETWLRIQTRRRLTRDQ